MNILTELSGWMYFPVIFAGLAYAAILYFKNKKLPFSKNVQYLLFVLRFVVVSLIAFLLLGPYLMRTKKNVEQPILLFAQDNSASILQNVDSLFYKTDYTLKLDSLTKQFNDNYTVEHYTFGQNVIKSTEVNFLDQRTDFSALFQELKNTYYNRNVGALVLFSDGIYNSGVQPELLAEALPFPIYTVGLGDTMVHPDVNIADLRYNRLIYNKTDFPVEVTIKAIDALGEKLKVSIFMEDKKVGEQEFVVASKRFSISPTFMISAGQNGRKKMRAEVTGVENETVLLNNKRDFYIEIINQKQSILILAKAPHPDLAAIKAVFEDNFDVTNAFVQSWKPDDKQYNLLILHELPGEGVYNIPINEFIDKNKSLP
ncbi:MAG: hypothetical protein Q8T08_19490, partial [Ignavibacteria bacterium]|nr:hypothetical protein [Ignavibacteria bacterium]